MRKVKMTINMLAALQPLRETTTISSLKLNLGRCISSFYNRV